MTAIAVIPCHDGFHVVGDLALSGPEDESSDFPLVPTIGSTERVFPRGSGFVVSSLCSKVISPRQGLVLAWAGLRLPLREVAALLAVPKVLSKSSLERAARLTTSIPRSAELTILGVVRTRGKWKAFRLEKGRLYWAKANEALCDGSGGEDLLRACRINPKSWIVRGKPSADERSSIATLTGCCSLILSEISGPTTLLRYYGAGYEIALARGERVLSIPLPTQICHDVIPKLGGLNLGYFRVIRYYYFERRLIVAVGDEKKQWTRFLVEDPLRPHSVEELARVESHELQFQSSLTCSHFRLKNGYAFMRIDSGKERIYIEDVEGGFVIAISERYRAEVSAELLKHPNGHADARTIP